MTLPTPPSLVVLSSPWRTKNLLFNLPSYPNRFSILAMYFELHSRSAFSFLEGASFPDNLAQVCSQQGLPGMALLDRNGVYGAPRFHLAARQCGIKAHIGAEISMAEGGNYP